MLTISKRTSQFILLAILLLSFSLNTYGNDFPLGYHADEPKKIDFVLFGEQDFHHPLLMLQTVRFANLFIGFHTRVTLIVLARFTTAVYGTLIVLLMYKIARRQLSRGFALGVALLTAVSPSIVVHSHYFKEDIVLTFATLLSIVCLFSLTDTLLKSEDKQKLPWLKIALLGLAIGLVVSAKYKSVIILTSFSLLPFYTTNLRKPTYFKSLFIALLIGALTFLSINFPIFTNFDVFLDGSTTQLEHALSGHNGINIYPIDQYFIFHIKNSITPSLTILPTILALAFVPYSIIFWKKLAWHNRFLLTFILLFYAIVESSPLKPFPGYIRYTVPLIPPLAYACVYMIYLGTAKLPKQTRTPIIIGALALVTVFPAISSLNLIYNLERDTRAELETVLATKQEPIAYEFYSGNNVTVRSLVELDQQIKNKEVCTLVASSFMYERYLFGQQFPKQEERIYGIADWYETLFETYPSTDIVPAYKSFAFSNPTLKVIDVCG